MFPSALTRAGLMFAVSLWLLTGCQSDSQGDIWPMVENCDLHQQTCVSKNGESQASLSITPHPIPIAKPLEIEARLSNLPADKVELDISGLNMYMGYNRVTLEPQNEPGHFGGRSMLAFCTNEVMLWQITLLVHHNGEVLQIPFQLETRNR
jgi:hypothetical protein